VASLVLGIAWFWPVSSILAVIFGHLALGQIERSDGRQCGRGLAIAGLALGYIALTLMLVVVLVSVWNWLTGSG
jgi:uncharacterized membrane protein YqjE